MEININLEGLNNNLKVNLIFVLVLEVMMEFGEYKGIIGSFWSAIHTWTTELKRDIRLDVRLTHFVHLCWKAVYVHVSQGDGGWVWHTDSLYSRISIVRRRVCSYGTVDISLSSLSERGL
ncbi:hypothetical protein L6452_41377 [Arctium lappa]|uniref:Uncharacterized protein n=1 Tax=Arctium lappa TaxID=4217 RepID=A0ACB8XPS1_ARCLA|nr:hypothetical protein L6452_41377 [Arctium lappa]